MHRGYQAKQGETIIGSFDQIRGTWWWDSWVSDTHLQKNLAGKLAKSYVRLNLHQLVHMTNSAHAKRIPSKAKGEFQRIFRPNLRYMVVGPLGVRHPFREELSR